MDNKEPALIEVSTKRLDDSFYIHYAPLCTLCKNSMDHPPIRLMIDAPILKAPMGEDAPPFAEGEAVPVCRDCMLEALAPLENSHESNPKAGWYFRSILRGDLEPRGVTGPRAQRVGEKVAEDSAIRQGGTEGDRT